jgi:hypothetical protein
MRFLRRTGLDALPDASVLAASLYDGGAFGVLFDRHFTAVHRYRAAAGLPGVRLLGTVTDAIGRQGIAARPCRRRLRGDARRADLRPPHQRPARGAPDRDIDAVRRAGCQRRHGRRIGGLRHEPCREAPPGRRPRATLAAMRRPRRFRSPLPATPRLDDHHGIERPARGRSATAVAPVHRAVQGALTDGTRGAWHRPTSRRPRRAPRAQQGTLRRERVGDRAASGGRERTRPACRRARAPRPGRWRLARRGRQGRCGTRPRAGRGRRCA